MRQTGGTRKEQIKDEGKSSRLRPQAEQIQDSAAAGSSPRQDNRVTVAERKSDLSTVQFTRECIWAAEHGEACGASVLSVCVTMSSQESYNISSRSSGPFP